MNGLRPSTQVERTGFALACAGFAVLVLGLIFAGDDADRMFRYMAGNYSRYHDGARLVFFGAWALAAGVFLWLAYHPTVGRLLRWIRDGEPTRLD